MAKTALIFGVGGMDGSHLAELLLKKKYRVVGVIRRASTDNRQRIEHIKGLELRCGEVIYLIWFSFFNGP